MKHRKQTQHWRHYRSGRWTCINRGIRYMTINTHFHERDLAELNKKIKRLKREKQIIDWTRKKSKEWDKLVWYDTEADKLNLPLIFEEDEPNKYDEAKLFFQVHRISKVSGLVPDRDRDLHDKLREIEKRYKK